MSFPNLSLTPSERHAFAHFYSIAEKGNGIVSGESAVAFFSYSGLAPVQLGQIWQLADTNNNGFLDQPGFSVALRLIGHVQNNEAVSEELIHKPGPIPQFDGIPPPPVPQVSSPSPFNSPSSPSPIQTQQVPPVNVDERSRFTRIFAGCGPINGLLSGDKARDVFIKSKLPFEVLGQIWNLSDTQNRGSLDLTDFIIGMHFIQCYMNKTVSQLPSALPAGVYEQASGGRQRPQSPLVSSPIQRQTTGGSQAGSPQPNRQVRFAAVGGNDSPQSLTAAPPVQSPTAAAAPLPTPTTGTLNSHPEEISAEEKSGYDGFYDSLNPSGNGVLEADKAVDFFSKSGLPIEILANVWDLADVRKSGSLSKDEFAIAMHLIHGCLGGKPLPSTLPESLIPASLRTNAPRKPADDLFDLMGDETDLQPAIVQPQHSGAAPAAGLVSQGTGLSAQSTGLSSQLTGQQPNPLQANVSGWQNPPQQQQQQPQAQPQVRSPFENPAPAIEKPALVDDLLGDSDVQQSKLHTDTAAAETARGQLSETDRALSDYQSRRADLETRVAAVESERNDLEQRLTNAKKAYETETRLVSDLQVKLTETTAERRRLEQELITAESDCSGQKVERAELETAYMREKEETRVLKAKILEISKHTAEMRQALTEFQETAQASKGENEEAKEQLKHAESDRDNAAKELKRYSNVDPAETLPTAEEDDLDEKLKDIEESKQEPEVKAENLETPAPEPTSAEDVAVKDAVETESANEPSNAPPAISTDVAEESTHAEPALEKAAATALPTSPESATQEETPSVSYVLSPSSGKSTNPFDNFAPSTSNNAQEEAASEDPFAGAGTDKGDSAFASFDDTFGKFDVPEGTSSKPDNANSSVADFDDAFKGFDSKPTNSKAAFDESFVPSASAVAPAAESKAESSPFDNFAPAVGAAMPEVKSKGKERDDDSSDDDEGPEELPQLSAQPPNLNPAKDEFDDAFSNFPTNAPAQGQSDASNKNPFEAMMGGPSGATADATKKDDQDDFDTSFADLPAAQIAAGNVSGDQNDFDNDEAFDFVADFDQPGTSNRAAPNKAFDDFSDTFSVQTPTSADGAVKPNLPPRTSETEEDDIKQVKQLVNMGFDRPQAIEALEKSGFNVEKALNKLLK